MIDGGGRVFALETSWVLSSTTSTAAEVHFDRIEIYFALHKASHQRFEGDTMRSYNCKQLAM